MYDSLLDLLSSTTIQTGAAAPTTGKFVGKNRVFRVWGRCGGDVTGAAATLSFTFEESTAATGGSWTAVTNNPSLAVTEQVGGVSATTPRPEIPSSVSPLPSVIITTTKDYLRYAAPTLGGTTPVFPAVTLKLEPIDAPILASGR